MGWIQDRHMKSGGSIGGYNPDSPKSGAPLVKIKKTLYITDDFFGYNRVLLECGHETHSNGTYRARCVECKKLTENKAIEE